VKSLRIDFLEAGAVLNLEEEIEGFEAVNQDALVNIGTRTGSDKTNPERGSSLEQNALQTSVVVSLRAATHVANIGASETELYIIENEDNVEDRGLATFDLQTLKLSFQKLELTAVATSVQGDQIGNTDIPLTT